MTHMQRGLFRDPSCCLVNWAHTIWIKSPSGLMAMIELHRAIELQSWNLYPPDRLTDVM